MSNSKVILSNFIWRLLERWGAQAVSLIVSMILARLLDPGTNGTVAIVTVFISLCTIFVDSGFGAALVQKKDSDDVDFSSVFYFNMVICTFLYFCLYLLAPWLAAWYEIEILTQLVRVQSITLIISGFTSVQVAYVSKHMLFKKYFFSTMGGTLMGAAIGVYMAYAGMGVWALVCQSLTSSVIGATVLWFAVKWRPKKVFSFVRLKSLFYYGSKLLLSSLMYTGYADLRQLIIGKIYTTSDLAYYNRASTVPTLINSSISASLGSVLLPAMSNVQDDKERVKLMVRRTILLHSYVLVPIFTGLLVCADSVVEILFSAKWLPSVPYLRIFCLAYFLDGIGMANQNAIKAMGKSGLALKIECVKTPVYVIVLLVTIPFGMMPMAIGYLASVMFSEILCALPGKKLIGYSVFQQLRDILPNLLLSSVMGGIVSTVSLLNLNCWFTLLIQVPVGVAVYVLGSLITKNESFYYLWNQIKGVWNKKTG